VQDCVSELHLYAGCVCCWDLVEETLLESFQAHSGVVCSLAIHPDGDLLLTSSTDGTVKVWQ
jgi:mitogen-activated protein kinase organizer 1